MDLRCRPETVCGTLSGANLAAGPGESPLDPPFFPPRVLPLLVFRFDESFGSFLIELADALSNSSGVPPVLLRLRSFRGVGDLDPWFGRVGLLFIE